MSRVEHLRERVGGGLAYGGDYNPEQWPEATWREDAALMRAAGVNLVTVGVFSWSRLEPRPGEHDFGWLDRVLDILADQGVAVDLATGTASPPPWLTARHPEVLPETADGVRVAPGSRQHYCPSSPVYREAARRLAATMAGRYGAHPALALWHVGNEYGVHTHECHCRVSAAHFRRWLVARHGTIDALNAAWGTDVWSQRYGGFEEVGTPRRMAYAPNPGHVLDWRRFCSDALLECYAVEREALRAATPQVAVTTNVLGLGRPLDLWRWASEQDVVAHDGYPDPADLDAAAGAALAADTMRSLRDGQPWLLMEQAPSAVDWRPRNQPKPPGVMRLWSLQAVARGADGVLFFQWRAARRGAEQFHSAMLPHGGPGTRTHREVVELGAELAGLAHVAGEPVAAQVALILDWESWWALEDLPRPAHDFRFLPQLRAHHAALWSLNVAVDVRPPDADLTAYGMVVVPNLLAPSDAAAANLTGFGGELVIGPFSGINDGDNAVRPGPAPAAFAERLGLRVEEAWPPPPGRSIALSWSDGTPAGHAEDWAEWVEPSGAEAVLRFAAGELAGRPAPTHHEGAWYLATRPDAALLRSLYARICAAAGVVPTIANAPAGVEAVRRGAALFLLNHASTPATVRAAGRTVELAPRGVRVLALPPAG